MSTSQRLLLVIVLLLAGGAVTGALLLGDEEARDKPSISGLDPAEVKAPPAAARTDLDGTQQSSRISAEGDPTGELVLQVINDQGASIPAELFLTSSEGQEVQAQGSTTWSQFPIGDWKLRARMEGLISYQKGFSVIPDEVTRITVQLLPSLEVRGKVVDRFGQSVGKANVWFMRRIQVHPADNTTAKKVQNVTTDTRGMFRAELDKKGEIRVSVGKPGKKVIESEPIFFNSAGPREITIVIAGTGRLEVQIQTPPPALAEGKANLLVTVLAEKNERGEGPRKRRTPGAKRKANKEGADQGSGLERELRGARGSGEATGGNAPKEKAGGGAGGQKGTGRSSPAPAVGSNPDQDQDQGAGADSDWTPIEEAYLPPEGSLSFKALPPDRDLVLMVTRRGDRFQSRPFRLGVDRASLVRFLTPTKRSDDERAAETYGELEVQVQERPLPVTAPQVGFTLD